MLKCKVLRLCLDARCVSWPFGAQLKINIFIVANEFSRVSCFFFLLLFVVAHCEQMNISRFDAYAFWEFISHLEYTLFHFAFLWGPSAIRKRVTRNGKLPFGKYSHSFATQQFPLRTKYGPPNMRIAYYVLCFSVNWRQFHTHTTHTYTYFLIVLRSLCMEIQIRNNLLATKLVWSWCDGGSGTLSNLQCPTDEYKWNLQWLRPLAHEFFIIQFSLNDLDAWVRFKWPALKEPNNTIKLCIFIIIYVHLLLSPTSCDELLLLSFGVHKLFFLSLPLDERLMQNGNSSFYGKFRVSDEFIRFVNVMMLA